MAVVVVVVAVVVAVVVVVMVVTVCVCVCVCVWWRRQRWSFRVCMCVSRLLVLGAYGTLLTGW